jgi:hypothetical protein
VSVKRPAFVSRVEAAWTAVGTNLMATNYNYTLNTHATEPLKFFRIRTQ